MSNSLLYETLPTVALRGLVIFPGMRIHFEVGRKKSISAVMTVMNQNQRIFLTAQTDIAYDDPTVEQLFRVGVIARVRQVVKTPGSDIIRIVAEGLQRGKIINGVANDSYLECEVYPYHNKNRLKAAQKEYGEALVRKTRDYFERYAQSSDKLAPDVAMTVASCDEPGELADYIASNAFNDFRERQSILECLNPVKRLEEVCVLLERETHLMELENDINRQVQQQMDKNQREYYLHEQMKIISNELGEGDDILEESEEYRSRICGSAMPQELQTKLLKECDRLRKMQSGSPDANVARCYLDACLALPWGKYTTENLSVKHVRKVLDADHYGLEKVKKRFAEDVAVRRIATDLNGQILCLVGPPGVGKTSVARSVAAALNRKFVRISLGGIRDEAEIRGHRRTYIGAMPGRIISALQQAGSMNPLILLDEIDKLGFDYKGDPSAALLEALDSEQNVAFSDNYIGLPVDLSKVLFITTANDFSNIPAALADRMEVIELSGYTAEEKLQIAKKHLLKQQMKAHGLNTSLLRITEDALRILIDGYTREAGVRKLKQNIAQLCRCAAVELADGTEKVSISGKNLESYLGPRKFKPEESVLTDKIGVVNGLAWTAVGGEMLAVEVLVLDGSGKIELTGNLGDVMKESAMAAVSYIRSIAASYGIPTDFYKTKDIHIHVPQGAVPKDGPSAGVTLATALLSALSGRKVCGKVAMTGEISLTGRVMPIGGLREKTMAAYINGIKRVIIPTANSADLWEVADKVKENVEFIFADCLDTVFATAILPAENTMDSCCALSAPKPLKVERTAVCTGVSQ